MACSGGGDSVALAALTAEAAPALGVDVHLAHLDHGLRPESAAEGVAVAALGERLGLSVRRQVLEIPRTGNLEAEARRARYDALGELAAACGAGAILTGHTADDRAETLWMWLLRGTGLSGLNPLPARRLLAADSPLLVLRPLLGFRREALRDWLRARELPWLEDPSNADLSLRRNRVRHELLPGLAAAYGVDAVRAAGHLNQQMAEVLAHLDRELAAVGFDDDALRATELDRHRLAGLPPALRRRALYRALAQRQVYSNRAVDLLMDQIPRPAYSHLELPGGQVAKLVAGALILCREGEPGTTPSILPMAELPPGGLTLPDAAALLTLSRNWALRLRWGSPGPLPADANGAVFDADRLDAPLRLVTPPPAIAMRALGGPGRRPLKRYFADRRIPPELRERWPVLLDGRGRPLWLPGLARSDIAPVTPRTRRCLCLDLEGPSA